MGSQVGARWGLATLKISTRKIWYNWTIPPNQFLGEIRNKKKIRHCGKKQIFFSFRFGIEDFERPAPFPGISEKSSSFANFIGFWFFWSPRPELSIQSPFNPFFLSPFHRKRISVGWSDVFPFFSSGLLPISRKWIRPEQRRRKIDFRFCFKLKLSLKKYFWTLTFLVASWHNG